MPTLNSLGTLEGHVYQQTAQADGQNEQLDEQDRVMLVSYDQKHNLANGHDDTDGTNQSYSWNCGWEGDEGAPPEVMALRKRQAMVFQRPVLLRRDRKIVEDQLPPRVEQRLDIPMTVKQKELHDAAKQAAAPTIR